MTVEPIRELILSKLASGEIPALTETIGKTMEEACAICLEDQKHQRGVNLRVELRQNGSSIYIFKISEWKYVDDKTKRAWGDYEVATEQAGYGIALLFIEEITEFTAIERARKGGGFDFWLGDKQPSDQAPFNKKARLEVSGIRSGDRSSLESRVKLKLKQVNPSDHEGHPAFIAVIEFSNPMAVVVRK